MSIAPSPAYSERKFWDKKNRALFAAITALNVGDFAVTHANLQNGGNETIARVLGGRRRGWWRTPRAKLRAGVTGLSYLFRKTRHRKRERIVSVVNIGASGAAVSNGLAHR